MFAGLVAFGCAARTSIQSGKLRMIARRWSISQDHYYWLTAFLAARGAQTSTCRVIALMIVGLGAIPLTLIGSPIGPQGQRARILAAIVAACCLVMAVSWLRHRWPTRVESGLQVVAGTLCIAVACLIVANPFFGLLGTTAFAMLTAYIAFFHTAQLLAFTWTVAAATLGVLAVRLAASDVALAVSSVLLVALVNIFVGFVCRMVIRLVGTEIRHGEIEPLTGLLNRDAFYLMTATLLASRSRDDDRHLVVSVVNIDNFSLLVGIGGSAASNRARVTVGQTLRENVRHDAIVAHVADAEFLIADTFTTVDPSPLIERVSDAITTTPSRLAASIGVVSTPLSPLTSHAPHDVLDELITIATSAMYEARKAGGNQARYVLGPALTVVDDPDNRDGPDLDKPT
jgi:diguanylate cyclase (GGDEF)-like protein